MNENDKLKDLINHIKELYDFADNPNRSSWMKKDYREGWKDALKDLLDYIRIKIR